MSTDDTDNWSINCADNDEWEPSVEELETFYFALENGKDLQLEWICHGRRSPTPIDKNTLDIKVVKPETENRDKDGFDFMDEMSQTPQQMRIRSGNSTPKGSAKKKTTVFSGVLDSMKKHGRLTSGNSTPNKTNNET